MGWRLELLALERGGQISDLKAQVRFELVPAQKGQPAERESLGVCRRLHYSMIRLA